MEFNPCWFPKEGVGPRLHTLLINCVTGFERPLDFRTSFGIRRVYLSSLNRKGRILVLQAALLKNRY